MWSLLLFAYAFVVPTGGSPTARSTAPIVANITISTTLTSVSTADACTDIAICRTRYTIIWSSLFTILACVWTAVHRNVPEPERADESPSWHIVGRVLEAVKIVAAAVLVPEWVLAWAVRQRLNAHTVRKELESARHEAQENWDAKQEKLSELMRDRDEGEVVRDESMAATSSETSPLLPAEGKAQLTRSQVEKSKARQLAFDDLIVAANQQTGRSRGRWTLRHGFSVIMGGFHYYRDGEPRHPLSRWDIVALVKSGDLVPPTDEELRTWSQGDTLSKMLAIIQTLWFVIQAIARRIEDLPITQLEIMTLAYTTITVAMYAAWWDKPQNVGGPIRATVKKLPEQEKLDEWDWYEHVFYAIIGWQDDIVDLRKERRVPTFYGGGTGEDSNNGGFADILALFAALVFGAVHCAAWHYSFPSHIEKFIWHISSLAIVVIPAVMLVLLLVAAVFTSDESNLPGVLKDALPVICMLVFLLSAPIYVAARLLLLALSFSTLRSLPPEAYRAVQWTLRIPHFT
ncbi:hypothetical protein BV25DRAFT_1022277 [Artomyces pyxidatus]|uniref:Uncharacterized protein n=1 Tax=Artomyces pyxidatus TaxID=48021 RepID=A0ACB8SU92_9AGAM|nr:hypothetical protein BV25DRAFT_1022277 [Artomyces pyxidatus]